MTDLDERGLELAGKAAYETDWPKDTWERLGSGFHQDRYRAICAAAIRAYEAHKTSAVPEEIAEVVEWLRSQIIPELCKDCDDNAVYRRAADLLEQMATKNEVLTAVVKELGGCLDELITPPSSSKA